MLLLPIFAVWSYTSWAATMIRPGLPSTQAMVLVVMLLGLFMHAAVPEAFGSSAWGFVAPLLVIQLGRTAWTIVLAPTSLYRDHYVRVAIWQALTAPAWMLGAVVAPEARLVWWAAAALVDMGGTWLAHPIPGRRLVSINVEFDAAHMLERCRLFLIIALGETVLAIGNAIAGKPLATVWLAGTCALIGTTALWAIAFGRTHRLVEANLEASPDPIRVSRYAVNALIVAVAGLVATAVASELVIAQPHEHASPGLSVLLGGGPALFLCALGWYRSAMLGGLPKLHVAAVAACGVVGILAPSLPACGALALSASAFTTLAAIDRR